MKYITTDKHPELNEGIILQENAAHDGHLTEYYATYHKTDIEHMSEKGYIKEVEEKEYTKSDMINFGQYYGNHTQGLETAFNEYLKIRG